jgi:hypothetical protein
MAAARGKRPETFPVFIDVPGKLRRFRTAPAVPVLLAGGAEHP